MPLRKVSPPLAHSTWILFVWHEAASSVTRRVLDRGIEALVALVLADELTQGSVVPDFCRIARLWSIWRDGKLKELRSGYKILLIIRTVRDTEPCFVITLVRSEERRV